MKYLSSARDLLKLVKSKVVKDELDSIIASILTKYNLEVVPLLSECDFTNMEYLMLKESIEFCG